MNVAYWQSGCWHTWVLGIFRSAPMSWTSEMHERM